MSKGRGSGEGSKGGGARLADALGERRAVLEARLPAAPEPQPEPPAPRIAMTPTQLMQLAFELVSRPGEPELTLDWDRIEVVEAIPDGARGGDAVDLEAQTATAPDPPTPDPAELTAPLRSHTWTGAAWRDEGVEHDPVSPMSEHDVHVRAGRAGSVPRLKLRGLTRSSARDHLDDFVILARHAQLRVVRIVTGKGLGSRGEPVLRPMLKRWLARERGRSVSGWCYELDADGAWGSVLVVLRPGSR